MLFGLINVVLKVAVRAEIFLVATIFLEESTWVTDALGMKNAPQGRHLAFMIGWDERVELRGDLMNHQVLTPQMSL